MYDKFVGDHQRGPSIENDKKTQVTPNNILKISKKRGGDQSKGLTPSQIYSLVHEKKGSPGQDDLFYNSNASEDPRLLSERGGQMSRFGDQEPEEYVFVPRSNEKYPKQYRTS